MLTSKAESIVGRMDNKFNLYMKMGRNGNFGNEGLWVLVIDHIQYHNHRKTIMAKHRIKLC
jgi:hypothetical protein